MCVRPASLPCALRSVAQLPSMWSERMLPRAELGSVLRLDAVAGDAHNRMLTVTEVRRLMAALSSLLAGSDNLPDEV